MNFTIVIIGIGALGKRHLSSILNSELPLNVYCYDINQKALDEFEWHDVYHNKTLDMVSSLAEFPKQIDLAVFSMTSQGRRNMFDNLVAAADVKNILFEKVLFQTREDYEHVGNRLQKSGINAWVNCARRQMDCYQNLQRELAEAKEMRITISGGEWGLACNAIHEIDIIEFLADSKETVVEKVELLPEITESKRPGFKEVYGTVKGHSGKCKEFTINCMKNNNTPDIMLISSDIGQYIVIEGKKKMICMTAQNGYELEEKPFNMLYQSQMTQYVMEDILLRQASRLTCYEDSARLHLQFICPLIKFFEERGMEEGKCPIT